MMIKIHFDAPVHCNLRQEGFPIIKLAPVLIPHWLHLSLGKISFTLKIQHTEWFFC